MRQELSAFDDEEEENSGGANSPDAVASASPRSRKESNDGDSTPLSRRLSSDGAPVRRKSSSDRDEKVSVAPKTEKKNGSLIEEEKRAQGSDVWKLLKKYCSYIGLRNVFIMILFLSSLAGAQRYADYWLSQWTSNPDSE